MGDVDQITVEGVDYGAFDIVVLKRSLGYVGLTARLVHTSST